MADVVDTNVPLVVKHGVDHPAELRDACEELIETIMRDDRVVVTDEGDEIIDEYFNKLNRSGAPTLADAFAKWVYERRWTWGKGAVPDIQRTGDCEYEVLAGDDHEIDPSDRKFVAAAKVAGAPIHQATDTKWLNWAGVLGRHGVTVLFVHEPSIRAAYQAKFGRSAP